MSTPSTEREYVLGTHEEELARLGLQHRLWGAQAYAIWERAGFRPGMTLLDVGCGPGHATFDLAALAGAQGRVIAVDVSSRFASHVQAQAAARGVTNVDVHVGDVEQLEVAAGSVDGAYARWVLCFVRDPAAVVSAVARALRPGAAFAVQDYFNYTALALAPRSRIFEKLIAAVAASWREAGGDPDLVGRLPAIMDACGLELREVRPILRTARPHEPLWQWPTTFFRNFVPLLVRSGHLSAQDAAAVVEEWEARSRDPHTFFQTPPVFDVIGVKRG